MGRVPPNARGRPGEEGLEEPEEEGGEDGLMTMTTRIEMTRYTIRLDVFGEEQHSKGF